MREISAEQITQVVRRLCIEANCHLPQDMKGRRGRLVSTGG